jgi:sugar lactone lactonase YvrE
MAATTELLSGLGFGESPRWHLGRLWFCNWGTAEVVAFDPSGSAEVIMHVPTSIPYSIDWLPDGSLLVVCGREARLLRETADGSLEEYADLSAFGDVFNEIVVDGRGNAFVNGGRIDASTGAFLPGVVVLVSTDGSVRQVAHDIHFGNGMAVTPDDAMLIVAESHAGRLSAFDIGAGDGGLSGRRVWADLGDGAPDGICLDTEGAVWYADVPNRRCVRVREGGHVLERVQADRGCFACMLGGPEGDTLYIMAAKWRGMEHIFEGDRTGQVLATRAPARHAGRP